MSRHVCLEPSWTEQISTTRMLAILPTTETAAFFIATLTLLDL
jgi:hypothetical protein